jgi:hypothetical protein
MVYSGVESLIAIIKTVGCIWQLSSNNPNERKKEGKQAMGAYI